MLRGSGWEADTGAIGILRIKFVPEPSGWVMLASGLVFLMVIYKRQRIRGTPIGANDEPLSAAGARTLGGRK